VVGLPPGIVHVDRSIGGGGRKPSTRLEALSLERRHRVGVTRFGKLRSPDFGARRSRRLQDVSANQVD
jgi:hypothetical protein